MLPNREDYDTLSTLRQGEVFRTACENLHRLAATPNVYFGTRALMDAGVRQVPGNVVDSLLIATEHLRTAQAAELIGPLALEHTS